MCRLYAFRANEPTRVECSLVHAQNALMEQSKGDMAGAMHGHGWGVADYKNGPPLVEKQTWAAFHGEHFAKKAARVYAKTVVAHVRSATVGELSIENTHPFENGPWIFAHNGTLPNFDQVEELMRPHIGSFYKNELKGTTDSEHIFMYLLTLWRQHPERPLVKTVTHGLKKIIGWCRDIDTNAPIGLNIVLTDGKQLVGSRFGRTLWQLKREHILKCKFCGKIHSQHKAGVHYKAVEIASEPITDENWCEVPDKTIYEMDEDYYLNMQNLDV
jgi:predicted glutamine amidotransferase